MTTKHTPAPWFARKMHFGSSGNGTPFVSAGDTSKVLFFMNLSGAYGGFTGEKIAMNDARLSAAAPDMLEALQLILTPSPHYPATQSHRDLIAEARAKGLAAIKKATEG